MERIKGLVEYVSLSSYREALALPEKLTEKYELLAQGEYNINYALTHPVSGERLLLRVNTGSQMHLDKQIEYEANALKLLEPTGRTPKLLYVDGSKKHLDYGVLVMSYLPGQTIDYLNPQDMNGVAECLADIHAQIVSEDCGLIAPDNLLKAMLEECEQMVSKYMESELGDPQVKSRIRALLDRGWEMISEVSLDAPHKCCINTELNSTNFLVEDGYVRLVDWEKPLYGDPAQDLGHLLTPTTTFWKTDVLYTDEQVDDFLAKYLKAVNGRFSTEGLIERTKLFLTITCLRGITWCAMAWVEYQDPDKLIANESTRKKLDDYLSDWMLTDIEARFGIR